MLGCTAFTSFSKSARVITVLQSAGVALLLGGFSQSPWTVITGASGATMEFGISSFESDARGLRVGAGFGVWPVAMAASSRQTTPCKTLFKEYLRGNGKDNKESKHRLR